jgi:hypothetical protein
MKKIIYIFLALASVLNFSACKKCTKCSVFDSAGNTIYEDRESCGNKSDIEDAKTEARDESALLGGTFVCEDED